ncbi:MAG: type I phosphomannose isomerase catalytic subunit, partial [Lachnospiraceae bacterium]|nr:type I phosphomannose isomerase catalytic subunit [Lachnospiraceae bacterium]
MSVLKLKPACKDYLWGGHRLAEEYGIEYDGDILAESWELSCHPDGPSTIVNGPFAGLTLEEYIEKEGKQVLGNHCRRFRDFPILIKFIDAKQNLSIQVHPDNKYALKNEGQYGKTEMWYIMDAKEGAFLYYGFKKEISKEEFAKRIEEDTLLEVLNAVPVHKGDVLFIESGTIHAIGENILIAEIQQNSNVTYRVYDYGRVGKDGKKRDLHIEKALAVTNRVPIVKSGSSYPHVADCDYFTVDKLNLDGCMMKKMEGTVTDDSFVSILMLDGEGTITCGDETVSYKKGDSLFLPAGSGSYTIAGSCDALVTSIREKAGPVRVGIDIGGTDTKIGLVDVNQQLLTSTVIPTEAETGAEAVIKRIGEAVLALMEQEQIAMDQCIGVGVGVPGTVDRKAGMVVYSNNIKWEQVPMVSMLSAYLPVPIQIANDADCAALGEAVSGAAKDYQDVVMLTLGTGVGGGIILDGKIYEGGRMGGCELG